MFPTLHSPTLTELPTSPSDTDANLSVQIRGNVETGRRCETRAEILERALRVGFPLHRLEDYFDWLDMVKRT